MFEALHLPVSMPLKECAGKCDFGRGGRGRLRNITYLQNQASRNDRPALLLCRERHRQLKPCPGGSAATLRARLARSLAPALKRKKPGAMAPGFSSDENVRLGAGQKQITSLPWQ
jgi:hypothetical protein